MYHKKIKSNNEEFHKGFYENMKEDIPNQLMKIEDCNPKEEFKRQVERLMQLAKESLELKRVELTKWLKN